MSSLPETLVRFRDELEAAIRREQEAQAQKNGLLHSLRERPSRIALAFAALAVVVAAALTVSAPWQTSPGFLERAQAALAPPEQSILHMKTETWYGADPDCEIWRGPEEIWLDRTPPHRYRFLADWPRDFADAEARKPVCTKGPLVEFGGRLNTFRSLEFVPPNTLLPRLLRIAMPLDPAADLREAIRDGRAHDEGTTQLDGVTVRRIRFDPPRSPCMSVPPGGCPREPMYTYVDPDTFRPVARECHCGWVGTLVRVHMKTRYLEFEYLPRTAENLKLTDIRAQHPDARGP
jgi:hypothetical protein